MHKIILLPGGLFCVERPNGTRTTATDQREPLFFDHASTYSDKPIHCVAFTPYWGSMAGVHSLSYVVSQTFDEAPM